MSIVFLMIFLPTVTLFVIGVGLIFSFGESIKKHISKRISVIKQETADIKDNNSILDHKLAMIEYVINDMVMKKYPHNTTWNFICNGNTALLFHGSGHILVYDSGETIKEKIIAQNLFGTDQRIYFQSDADADAKAAEKEKKEQLPIKDKVTAWFNKNITMILDRTKTAQCNGEDYFSIAYDELDSHDYEYIFNLCDLFMQRGYTSAEKIEEKNAILIGVPEN